MQLERVAQIGRRTIVVSVTTLLVAGGVADAAFTTPACLAKKRTAWTTLRKCQGIEQAKRLLGKTYDLTKCQAKFTSVVAKIDAKASMATVGCRYGDSGDGTVIDYDTGLEWEKKTPGTCSVRPRPCLRSSDCVAGVCVAGDAHYVNDVYALDDAATYVNGTSTDGSTVTSAFAGFAGHSDWRLPTISELGGIVDRNAATCALGGACIDPTFGPTAVDKVGLFSPFYWSATTDASDSTRAWSALSDLSQVDALLPVPKLDPGHVRAVRSAL